MKSWVITLTMNGGNDRDDGAADSFEAAINAAMAEVDFNAASGKRSKCTFVIAVQPVTAHDGAADPVEEDPAVVEVVVEAEEEGRIKVRRNFAETAEWLDLKGVQYYAAHDGASALVILPRDLAIRTGLL